MTTIINNPNDEGVSGVLIGVILVLVLGAIFFYVYGMPFQKQAPDTNDTTPPDTLKIEVTAPQSGDEQSQN